LDIASRNTPHASLAAKSLIFYDVNMSGHSHWAQVKHQKGATDLKRGRVFSKLCTAITAAARGEPNPEFNPRLRDAILKAKQSQVPGENIERAIKRATESGAALEELTLESYGPGGIAILIEAITDNRNRTIAEVKRILVEHHGKWAEPGSVIWAFSPSADKRGQGVSADIRGSGRWTPKFPQQISADDAEKLRELIEALEEHDDVQKIFTSAA
jgi:transcriptional/translational regulatory protein YebC/TACO1